MDGEYIEEAIRREEEESEIQSQINSKTIDQEEVDTYLRHPKYYYKAMLRN